MSEIKQWGWPDLVAAVTDLVEDQARCSGCGLSETDSWWVKAETHRCPTCADRDVRRKDIPEKHSEGWRVRFTSVEDDLGMLAESSASRHTPEGVLQRKQVIARHRASE